MRHFTTAAGERATARRNVWRAPTAPIGALRHFSPLQKIRTPLELWRTREKQPSYSLNTVDRSGHRPVAARAICADGNSLRLSRRNLQEIFREIGAGLQALHLACCYPAAIAVGGPVSSAKLPSFGLG